MVVAVLGVALFNSAKWVMLDGASGIAMGVTYTTRFTGIATFLVAAALFFDRRPRVANMLSAMVPFVVICLAASLVAPALQEDMLGDVVLYATGVLYGIASSLFMLLYACIFSSYEPRVSAVLFGCAQLCTNCLMLALVYLDPAALHLARSAFLLTGTLVVACVAAVLVRCPALSDLPLECAAPEKEAPGVSESWHAVSPLAPAGVPVIGGRGWALLVGAAVVYHTVFGVVAQVSSAPGGSFGLYDVYTDVVIVVLDILLLAFLCFFGDRFGPVETVSFATVLYASGLLLYAFDSPDGGLVAGALVRGGFDCLRTLTMALLARVSFECPARTCFYFGLYRGVSSVYVGRAVGSFLVAAFGLGAGLVSGIARVSLWTVSVGGAAALCLVGRDDHRFLTASCGALAAPLRHSDACSVSEGSGERADDFALRLDAFSERLRLSQREREVLVETLHGQSRSSVAKKLCLSPETVKEYLGRVYTKAGVGSKQEIIRLVESEPLP